MRRPRSLPLLPSDDNPWPVVAHRQSNSLSTRRQKLNFTSTDEGPDTSSSRTVAWASTMTGSSGDFTGPCAPMIMSSLLPPWLHRSTPMMMTRGWRWARRDFDPEPAPMGSSARSSSCAAHRAAVGGGSRGANLGEYNPTRSSSSSNRITSFNYSYPTRSTL
jgi:hypothetical protein